MSARPPVADFERPAVFLVNGFGDQLIALPAMRALATIFPGGMQLLLGECMFSFFYRGLPFSEPVRVWWHDVDRLSIDVDRIIPGTRPCDLFLNLSTWASQSVKDLAHRMGTSWSVGFSEIFNELVSVDKPGHTFDGIFSLPQRLRENLRIEDFSQPPDFSPAAEGAAKRFVRERVPPGSRILFLHPETKIEKMWSAESFSWVVERFLDRHPEFTVFVATVKPFPIATGRHRDRIFWLDVHLELAFAIMRHADLFLGIDSCFLHAADLFRMPGIGLFGPSKPQEWGFRFSPNARAIWAEGPMEGIGRESVFEQLLEIAEFCEDDFRGVRSEAADRSATGSPMRSPGAANGEIQVR